MSDFCRDCGSGIGDFSHETIYRIPEIESVYFKMSGRMKFAELIYPDDWACAWVPDHEQGQPRDFGVDDGDEVTEFDREKELAWFVEAYKSEIDVIREDFGAENISIQWGVLRWSS